MKLIEAITRVDKLKYNTYGREEKLAWLSELDGMVQSLMLATWGSGEAAGFSGYSATTADNTPLLVPAPYDVLYLHWLEAKIDYYNGEYSRYNNAIELFNTCFQAYADALLRMHKPSGKTGFC